MKADSRERDLHEAEHEEIERDDEGEGEEEPVRLEVGLALHEVVDREAEVEAPRRAAEDGERVALERADHRAQQRESAEHGEDGEQIERHEIRRKQDEDAVVRDPDAPLLGFDVPAADPGPGEKPKEHVRELVGDHVEKRRDAESRIEHGEGEKAHDEKRGGSGHAEHLRPAVETLRPDQSSRQPDRKRQDQKSRREERGDKRPAWTSVFC